MYWFSLSNQYNIWNYLVCNFYNMCDCTNSPCECEDKRSELVRAINHLVESMMRKICDMDKEKAEPLMLKLFQSLGKTTDLKVLAEKLIKYRAELEIKKLNQEVKEEEMEDAEEEKEDEDLSGLFQ